MADQRSLSPAPDGLTRDRIPTELQPTLPAAAYLGQEGWRAEVLSIFTREWLCSTSDATSVSA